MNVYQRAFQANKCTSELEEPDSGVSECYCKFFVGQELADLVNIIIHRRHFIVTSCKRNVRQSEGHRHAIHGGEVLQNLR